MPNLQGKFWVFTLNNYTDAELLALANLSSGTGRDDVVYLIYGKEVGESGTPHLQGYVEFPRNKRLGGVKRLIGERCHFELRRGTAEEAATYCKKEGDFTELGNLHAPEPGRRTDLDTIRAEIEDGATELQIAENYFGQWCYHRKSFEKYRQLRRPNGIRDSLRVIVLWGTTGTGKSRYCHATYPELYSCPDSNLCWFDGYSGQDTVLIDEYRGLGDPGFLLKLLDIYPMQVPFKGGFAPWTPKTILITSNLSPPFGHEQIGPALLRRVHAIVRLDELTSVEDIHQKVGDLVGERE